ncbi:hypothetical protein RDI58_001228 [Solanum bulbocastanum]|uniref:Uncharacterized protein n=1 Tax=Solanum bulbocastanum TaxID=147425 RepID=A0AAN8YPX4_SOLBU
MIIHESNLGITSLSSLEQLRSLDEAGEKASKVMFCMCLNLKFHDFDGKYKLIKDLKKKDEFNHAGVAIEEQYK